MSSVPASGLPAAAGAAAVMATAAAAATAAPLFGRTPSLEEIVAAAKIQAIARGHVARAQVHDMRLWQAWNELDQKEEAELMQSHGQFEELKADLKRRKAGLPAVDGDKGAVPFVLAHVDTIEAKKKTRQATTLPSVIPPTESTTSTPTAGTPVAASNPTTTAAATSHPVTSVPTDAAAPMFPPLTAAPPPTSAPPSPSGRTYMIRTKTLPKKPLQPQHQSEVPPLVPPPSLPSPSSPTLIPSRDVLHAPAPPPLPRLPSAPKKVLVDDGLTLTDPIQLDFVTAMMDHFKFNKALDLENVVELLRRVKGVLKAQPNVVHMNVATRITVVGDLHGQLDDLLCVFKLNGLPSPRNAYVFNGDFVDRGQYSCECVLTLFAFKLLYPKSMHLNRGNHEARDINSRDGFEKEVLQKYNHAVFDLFCDVFACLPLAAVISDQILVVHGGLANRDFTLAELDQEDRFHEIPPSNSLLEDILWSDPDNKPGRRPSPRGAGLTFGADITHAWLQANQMRLIIRSHECQQRGYQMHHGDTIITVFSASNYCGTVNNEGAFIILEKDLVPRIVPYFAKAKERLSRYRMRHCVLENDIIAKLLQRIADNRLALTNYYGGVDTQTAAGVRTVSRLVWAEGLKSVLQLNIPFLEFQDYLGLPKLGVDGRKKGAIDYVSFLLRFRPVNSMLPPGALSLPGESPVSPGGRRVSRTANQNVEAILEMLSKHKFELEALFRHFDLNGDDVISVSEFKEGVTSLQSLLGFEFADEDLDSLIRFIDTDGDNTISYTEFFNGFKLADPQLGEVQRKAATLIIKRNKTGSGMTPSQPPSPAVSPRTLQEHRAMHMGHEEAAR